MVWSGLWQMIMALCLLNGNRMDMVQPTEGYAIINLFFTFLTGLAGGLLLYKLKVPGGMMVGAILSVTILSISSCIAFMPSEAKLTAQCLAGAFIACSVERDDLNNVSKLWKPLLVLLTSLLTCNLLLGALICLCSPLDLLTAMLSAVPGGMSDTPIIAADMGADAGKVAILQFVRMSTGIGVFPSLILLLNKNQSESDGDDPSLEQSAKTIQKGIPCFLCTLVAAFLCGFLGKRLGIPAGGLIFSMFGVIALKFLWGKAWLPIWAKRLAQILSGAYIGCGITQSDVLELRYLIVPALLVLIGYFLHSLLAGQFLHKLFGYSLKTAMLIATPAGASDMALISADLGVGNKAVIELQIIRMVVVISVFPQIIALIVWLFS